MNNIEQGITYSPTGNTESSARASEINNWSIDHARQIANRQGIDITSDHLGVIYYLRSYYVENGWPKRPHELTRKLNREFRHIGGSRYLHQLFPKGPLSQGAQLAGVPGLYNTVDKSFGTAH